MKIYKIKVNGKSYRVELEAINEVVTNVDANAAPNENKLSVNKEKKVSNTAGEIVISPIQGTVVNVKAKIGDHVKKGDVLVIIEAMKLENEVVSTVDGEVAEILISKGQNVTAKQELFIIK